MPSRKFVFFLPPDVEGCYFLKQLFQDKFGTPLRTNKELVFDYISHQVSGTSVDLKLYLLHDLEKYEKICPLYFTNVHTFVVVFDVAKGNVVTWEKICQDLKLHQSNSRFILLGYKKGNDSVNVEVHNFVKSHENIYLNISEHADLKRYIESLFENLDEIA